MFWFGQLRSGNLAVFLKYFPFGLIFILPSRQNTSEIFNSNTFSITLLHTGWDCNYIESGIWIYPSKTFMYSGHLLLPHHHCWHRGKWGKAVGTCNIIIIMCHLLRETGSSLFHRPMSWSGNLSSRNNSKAKSKINLLLYWAEKPTCVHTHTHTHADAGCDLVDAKAADCHGRGGHFHWHTAQWCVQASWRDTCRVL